VENLFDDEHDPAARDADEKWFADDPAAFRAKVDHLADGLLKMNGGVGPDIACLVEVESDRAATALKDAVNAKLQAAGRGDRSYQSVLFKVDHTGRRPGFAAAFAFGSVPLIALWLMGAQVSVITIVGLTWIASFFISMLQLGLVLYASELYPTRMRALGSGIGSAWTRVGSMVGQPIVGLVLQSADVAAVFLLLGMVALVGAATIALFGVETRGAVLEKLSP